MKLNVLSMIKLKLFKTVLILYMFSSVLSIKLSNDHQIKLNSTEKKISTEPPNNKNETIKSVEIKHSKIENSKINFHKLEKKEKVFENKTENLFSFKSLRDRLIDGFINKKPNKFDNMRFKELESLKYANNKTNNNENQNFSFYNNNNYLKINIGFLIKEEKDVLKKLLNVFFSENSLITELQNQLKDIKFSKEQIKSKNLNIHNEDNHNYNFKREINNKNDIHKTEIPKKIEDKYYKNNTLSISNESHNKSDINNIKIENINSDNNLSSSILNLTKFKTYLNNSDLTNHTKAFIKQTDKLDSGPIKNISKLKLKKQTIKNQTEIIQKFHIKKFDKSIKEENQYNKSKKFLYKDENNDNNNSRRNKTLGEKNYFRKNKHKLYSIIPKIIIPAEINVTTNINNELDLQVKNKLKFKSTDNVNNPPEALLHNNLIYKAIVNDINDNSTNNIEFDRKISKKCSKIDNSTFSKEAENENLIEIHSENLQKGFIPIKNFNSDDLSISYNFDNDPNIIKNAKFITTAFKDIAKDNIGKKQINRNYENQSNDEFYYNNEGSIIKNLKGLKKFENNLLSNNLQIISDKDAPVFNSLNKPLDNIETDDTIYFIEKPARQKFVDNPEKILEEFHKPNKGGLFLRMEKDKQKKLNEKNLQKERLDVVKDLKEIQAKCKRLKEKLKILNRKTQENKI